MKKLMRLKRRGFGLLILIFFLFASPRFAFADGGGPILLLINFAAFLYGNVWILMSEWLLYRYKGDITWKEAFWDVLVVNVASTIAIGLGFPFLIAALSGLLSHLLYSSSEKIGGFVMALGTWIAGDNSPYPKVASGMVFVWLVITFVLTGYFEAWILSKRWRKRRFEPKIKPLTLSWYSNGLSYSGLLLLLLIASLTGERGLLFSSIGVSLVAILVAGFLSYTAFRLKR